MTYPDRNGCSDLGLLAGVFSDVTERADRRTEALAGLIVAYCARQVNCPRAGGRRPLGELTGQ